MRSLLLRKRAMMQAHEAVDPLVDAYVQSGLIIQLDGKMKGGNPSKWIDRKGLITFNYGNALTPVADGVLMTEGQYVESNETFATGYIDTRSYSFEMIWELYSSPGTYMIFATPRSDYSNGPYIGVVSSGAIFGDPTTMRVAGGAPTYKALQISSGSSWTVLMDGVSAPDAGLDYFGGTGLHFYLGSPGSRVMPSAKLMCLRVYDRSLTVAEMQANLAVDGERFNLGLNL